MPYCTNCGTRIPEGNKFCPNCGTPNANYSNNDNTRRIVREGTLHKCPHCGDVVSSFTAICPSCGYEFREASVSSTVQSFVNVLSNASSPEQKVSVIRNYPIPNTKEDIFEFMLLATSNISGSTDKALTDAWQVKIEQAYQKAHLVIKDEKDLEHIDQLYAQSLEQMKKEKRLQNAKTVGKTLKGSGGLFFKVAMLIAKNFAIIAGIVLYQMAINAYNHHDNGSLLELIGGVVLIANAATLPKRNASLIEYILAALSGYISIYMSRFLDNGSMLEFCGGIVFIVVAVNFFKSLMPSGKV